MSRSAELVRSRMRIRPRHLLAALTAAYVSGILLGDGLGVAWHPVERRGAAGVLAGVALASGRRPRLRTGCALALTLVAGFEALRAPIEAAERDRQAIGPGGGRIASGRVCETQTRGARAAPVLCGVGLRGDLGESGPGRAVARLRLSAPAGSPEHAWLAGVGEDTRVVVRVRVAATRSSRNPGSVDWRHRSARRGVGATAVVTDVRLAAQLVEEEPASATPDGVRGRIARRLQASGPGGPLLAALGVGERSALPSATRDAFRALGIGHLLAVSGLHVGLVAALVFATTRLAAARWTPWAARFDARWAAGGGAAAAAIAYACAAGLGAPVVRATLFLVLALAAVWSRRPRPTAGAFLAALLIVGALSPDAVFSLGPQLSFGVTAALLIGPGQPHPGMSRVASAFAGSVRVSATAIGAGAPILALHGLAPAPIGLVSNLVAVPLTAFALLPAALVSAVLVLLEAPVHWLWPCERLAAVAAAVAEGLAGESLPMQAPRPDAATLVVGGALAVATAGARRTRTRLALCLATCAVITAGPRAAEGPPPPRVVAFDVGQGDALLVQGREASVLIDAGWSGRGIDLGRSVVVPGLRALGVERLDLVIATHADADHRGGLAAVLEQVEVGSVWIPNGSRDEFGSLLRAAARSRVPVRERARGDAAWSRGALRVETLWPPAGLRARGSRNRASLVTRLSVGGTRVLATGDIGAAEERRLLARPDQLRAEILKVPHHGSRSSSTGSFLSAVGFDLAILSAPCTPGSRLPHAEALARLTGAGGSLWWTGRDGAIALGLPDPAGGRAGPARVFGLGEPRDCGRVGARDPWSGVGSP